MTAPGRVPPDDGMLFLARSAALAHSTDWLTTFDWHMERDALLVIRPKRVLNRDEYIRCHSGTPFAAAGRHRRVIRGDRSAQPPVKQSRLKRVRSARPA